MKFPPAFFITGTDTGVGKTFVSAVLTIGLQASYWKPIQSGIEPYTDTEWVQEKTALSAQHFLPEAYKLKGLYLRIYLPALKEQASISKLLNYPTAIHPLI